MAVTSITTPSDALPGITIGPRLRAELVRRVRELECRFKPAPLRHARAGAVEGISENHTSHTARRPGNAHNLTASNHRNTGGCRNG
jgi:hypothetical protein